LPPVVAIQTADGVVAESWPSVAAIRRTDCVAVGVIAGRPLPARCLVDTGGSQAADVKRGVGSHEGEEQRKRINGLL